MAIELIAKIKQANNGTFKLVDAADVEMKDGIDLETYLENLNNETGKCTSNVYAGNKEPTDEDIVVYIDTNNYEDEVNNNITGTVLEEIQAMFKFLKDRIEQLEADNIVMKAEIEALKQGQVIVPDPDEEVITITGAILLPDGTPLLLNDDSYMLYGNGSISNGGTTEGNISVTGAVLLSDGTPLLLSDGAILLYENGKITTESATGIVEVKGAVLLDNNKSLLLNDSNYLLYNNGEIRE